MHRKRLSAARRRLVLGARAAVAAVMAGPAIAVAQVPGAPTLQNAFANPGLAIAGNVAGGRGEGGGQSFYGAAAGYGLMGGRLLVSGAAGMQRANDATRGAYGARLAAAVWGSEGGALGAAAFAGVGGAPRTHDAGDIETNAAVMSIPAGVTIGYRRALGETRGISGYASPIYRWTRLKSSDVSSTTGSFSVGLGVDVSLTRSLGATVGAEVGGGKSGGSSSTTWGLALSFVPGR